MMCQTKLLCYVHLKEGPLVGAATGLSTRSLPLRLDGSILRSVTLGTRLISHVQYRVLVLVLVPR